MWFLRVCHQVPHELYYVGLSFMSVIPHKESSTADVHTLNDDNDIYYVQPRHNTLDIELLTQQQCAVAVADRPPYICSITCPRLTKWFRMFVNSINCDTL